MHRASYRLIGLFSTLLALSLLSACTTLMPSIPTNWPQHSAQLKNFNTWTASGTMSITTSKQHLQSHFNWQQNRGNYNINWWGPLGCYHYQLQGAPAHVKLTTVEGKTYTAHSPEQLLVNTLNMHLPVSNLQSWIKGLPDPISAWHGQWDNQGNLIYLSQQGWTLIFSNYTYYGTNLPTQIIAKNPEIRLKLVIKEWAR